MSHRDDIGTRAPAPAGSLRLPEPDEDTHPGPGPIPAEALEGLAALGVEVPRCGRSGFRAGAKPCHYQSGHEGPCSNDHGD